MNDRDLSKENMNGNSRPAKEERMTNSFQPLGFGEIMFIIYRGKLLILSVFAIVIAFTVWHTEQTVPEYDSTSTIIIEAQGNNENLHGFQTAQQRNLDRDVVGVEVEILKNSLELAERVAARLIGEGITGNPADTIPLLKRQISRTGELSASGLAGQLPGRIEVTRLGDLSMLEIKATSTHPVEASMIANFYVQEYMDFDQSVSRQRLSSSGQYLRRLENERGENLQEQEQRIRTFLDQDHVMVMDHGGRRVAEDIDRLYKEIEQDELQLQLMDRQIVLLREEEANIKTMLDSRSGSGTVLRYEAFRTALAEYELQAEQYYLERPELRANPESNPELVIILRQIDSLESRLQEITRQYSSEVMDEQHLDHTNLGNHLYDIRREIRRAENERQDLMDNVEFKQDQIQRNETSLTQILEQTNQLEEMQRDQRIAEQLYTTLLERVQQNQIAEQAELGRIRLIKQAHVPGSPVRPNKAQNYTVGSLFGLLAGIGLVFLKKSVDNKIHDPEDMRKQGFNVIGVIPDMTKHIKLNAKNRKRLRLGDRLIDPRLVTLVNTQSGISEAFRRLRINVEFSLASKRVKSITVTSSKPGEGKSINAMNLALALAQSGKRVLLVDADLRKPTAHTLLGMAREPGLSDLLTRKIKFKKELFETGIENFCFLPCGRKNPNPQDLIGSDQMVNFTKSTAEFFDIVIYDTPPLQIVSDAAVLANESDATVLIARANDTEINLLEQTRQDLSDVGIEVSGAILNRFDYSKSNVKAYSYKYKYRNSYKEVYAEKSG
ncbi:MAG: polysaccharide biosynthesis tyrosine autokinase [Balneolales bacterium]